MIATWNRSNTETWKHSMEESSLVNVKLMES